MKSKIEEINELKTEIEYPVLMKNADGVVVLFTNPTTGTVVVPSKSKSIYGQRIGTHHSEWVSAESPNWTKVDRNHQIVLMN